MAKIHELRMNSIPANVKDLVNLRTYCVQSPAEEAPRKNTQGKLRESGEHHEHNQQACLKQGKEHMWVSAKEVRVVISGLQLQRLPKSHEFWEEVREIQRHTSIHLKKTCCYGRGGVPYRWSMHLFPVTSSVPEHDGCSVKTHWTKLLMFLGKSVTSLAGPEH